MNIFSATGLDDFSALSFRSVDAICGEDAPLETGHCQPAPDVNFAPAESTELALSLSFPSTQFWDFLDLDFPTPNATEASTSTENNPTDAPNSAPERVVETSSTKIKAKRPRGASLHCEERRSKCQKGSKGFAHTNAKSPESSRTEFSSASLNIAPLRSQNIANVNNVHVVAENYSSRPFHHLSLEQLGHRRRRMCPEDDDGLLIIEHVSKRVHDSNACAEESVENLYDFPQPGVFDTSDSTYLQFSPNSISIFNTDHLAMTTKHPDPAPGANALPQYMLSQQDMHDFNMMVPSLPRDPNPLKQPFSRRAPWRQEGTDGEIKLPLGQVEHHRQLSTNFPLTDDVPELVQNRISDSSQRSRQHVLETPLLPLLRLPRRPTSSGVDMISGRVVPFSETSCYGYDADGLVPFFDAAAKRPIPVLKLPSNVARRYTGRTRT